MMIPFLKGAEKFIVLALIVVVVVTSVPMGDMERWFTGEDIRDHTDDDLFYPDDGPTPAPYVPPPEPSDPDDPDESEPIEFASVYDRARYYLERDMGIRSFSTVSELEHWVRNNVRYIKDTGPEDLWKSPKDFIADGGGDCEDYVLFGLATLDRVRYDMRVWVVLIDLGTYWAGHVTLALHDTETGKYYTWCNWGVRSITAEIWDDPTKLHDYNGYWWVLRERCDWLYHIRSFDAPPDMTKGYD